MRTIDLTGSASNDSRSAAHDELVIKIADSAAEREAVYQFRYRIYCELLKRTQLCANHDCRKIVEPLDDNGVILNATVGSRTVGTLRINKADDPHADNYREFYRLRDIVGISNHRCTITTKLMVDPEFRKHPIGFKLARFGFLHSVGNGSLVDFIDCNPPKESYFCRLGYRYLFPHAVHPEFGLVAPMVLVFNDKSYFKKVRSPFSSLAYNQAPHPKWVCNLLDRLATSPPQSEGALT